MLVALLYGGRRQQGGRLGLPSASVDRDQGVGLGVGLLCAWYQERAMIKYIVVPATGTAVDTPVFDTALAVAKLLSAHLEFLHVRLDVQTVLTAMAANDVSGGAGYDQMLESLERDAAERQKVAETAFRDFCEQRQVPVSSDPA